jgi:hypothetical protein
MGNVLSRIDSMHSAKKVQHTEIARNILSSTVQRGRIIRPMTRARTASYGVVTPPPLDRWIEAVLMRCMSLVQGAATTLGMWLSIRRRDWHTQSETSALPQATPGTDLQERTYTHGVILGLVPRISVGPTRGLAVDPHETDNRDYRHKAENDSVDAAPYRMEADKVRVPGEGRGPVLRAAQTTTHRSALTRAGQTPALILSLSKDAGDAANGATRLPA